MIEYNEDSLVKLIFRYRGSVALRAMSFAVPAAMLAFLLVFSGQDMRGVRDFRQLVASENLRASQLWTAMSAILGLLLGFRTNRAMARFWEGTSLLHQMRGEWFDSVSCCVTFSRAAVFEKPDQVHKFRHTIVRLMSLCHGSALEEIAGIDAKNQQTIDPFGLDNATLKHLKACKCELGFNRVEALLHLIQSLITKALDDGVLKVAPPILSRVYQTLSRGFVNILNAKKIADTRFPFPYAQTIAVLLLSQVVLTPIVMAELTDNLFWAPVFTFIPVFGMCSINYIGIELENPFGDDDNDLPLDHFQTEMNNCLMMLLQESADLLPGISSRRCITDFNRLKKLMREQADNIADGSLRPTVFRVSSFESFMDDDLEDLDVEVMQRVMSEDPTSGSEICHQSHRSITSMEESSQVAAVGPSLGPNVVQGQAFQSHVHLRIGTHLTGVGIEESPGSASCSGKAAGAVRKQHAASILRRQAQPGDHPPNSPISSDIGAVRPRQLLQPHEASAPSE